MFNKIFKNENKLSILVVIIVLVIVVFIVFLLLFNNNEFILNASDSLKIKEEYEKLNNTKSDDGKVYPIVNLPENNKLVYTDINEIINIFNSNMDAVVFIGNSSCIYCRSAIQVLCDTLVNTDIDKAYYLDIDKEKKGYDELINVLEDNFLTDEDNIYIPLVLFIVNGNIVTSNKGTLFSQYDPYEKLDDSQIEGLSEIYRYGIYDVLEGMND